VAQLTDELKELDLSSLSFDEFVEFFFARKVVSDKEQYDYFLTDLAGEKYSGANPSAPLLLVNYLTKLFSEFGRIANRYTLAQIDQGVWGILGANLRLYEFFFDSSVPLADRVACIRSMYHVYSDFVSKLETELAPDLSGFFMWWDLILHGFWDSTRPCVAGTWKGDASKLDSESRVMLDAMFETLKRILSLPDRESHKSALHGLGHLYHPGVRAVVQEYIDSNNSGTSLKWLEQCRDCDVL
jgi:hypothetical protein